MLRMLKKEKEENRKKRRYKLGKSKPKMRNNINPKRYTKKRKSLSARNALSSTPTKKAKQWGKQ
jgi:hypothetical protein